MVLLNLTPHPLRFVLPGADLIVPPDMVPARLEVTHSPAGEVRLAEGGRIPLLSTRTGPGMTGLPAAQADTLLIVSQLLAHQLADRTDLVYPALLLRDSQGAVVGAQALAFPRRAR